MTDRTPEQPKPLADIIVEKFRNLFALENRVLEASAQAEQITTNRDAAEPSDPQATLTPEKQETLTVLQAQLKQQVAEMEAIIDELSSANPALRTYVLPQMREIVRALKASGATAREELAQLVAGLTDDGNTQSLEQLEAIIIVRLRDNLEKTFGT